MSIIVDALVSGAAAGGKDVASSAVRDLYARLKDLVLARLSGRPPAQIAINEVEVKARKTDSSEPGSGGGNWREVLESELVETNVVADRDVLALARELLDLLNSNGISPGPKYAVDSSRASGVVIGDRAQQRNYFGASTSGDT